jgi:hypothetical protein
LKRSVIALAFAALLICSLQFSVPTNATTNQQNRLVMSLQPSSVTIKVGDTATVNVILMNSQNNSIPQVCFDAEGFPSTGFITVIVPQCTPVQPYQTLTASLNVTATPAAAPQNVTALIVARGGTLVAQTFLYVTVVPALPAWIPWSMIGVFVAILGVSLFYGNTRKRHRRR